MDAEESEKEIKSSLPLKRISALILVPTRDLASQVTSHLNKLSMYCSKRVKIINLSHHLLQVKQVKPSSTPSIPSLTPPMNLTATNPSTPLTPAQSQLLRDLSHGVDILVGTPSNLLKLIEKKVNLAFFLFK